jgi:glycosyltransferase involved in cell wall biosynthesis
MIQKLPTISIIVPLYNEEQNLDVLFRRLHSLKDLFSFSLELIFIDDGSSDSTPLIISQLALLHTNIKAILLSRNFGHQAAVSAGLLHSTASEAIFVIDGDLQDPPELLGQFYEKNKLGYDVVYGVRKSRKEGFLLRFSYKFFYIVLSKISNIKIPLDSGDFCLMSRRVVDILNSMPEESRFLRGMRSWVGFSQIGIPYDRDNRNAGNSKYSFLKLLNLALDGFFDFTKLPTRFIFVLGFISMIISFCYLIYSIFLKLFYNLSPEGFTGLLFIIVFISSIQMISISILGEYIVRIFFQTKSRPLFIIKTIVEKNRI